MGLLIAGAVVALTTLLPLGYVVVGSAGVGLGPATDFLLRPRVGELLWNTTRLLAGGVVLTALVGVGAAWLVVRSDLPGRGLWHGLLCAPLAVPSFVNGYAWISATHAAQSYAGAVWVVSLSYFPLVYLPTVAGLRRVDAAHEDVAASLGLGAAARFFRVVLPVVSPAVLGGALLVGLHLLGEYGALQLLAYPTLTTGVLDQYRTAFDGPAATLLALVLVAFCLLLLVIEALARGRRRRARVGRGVVRTPEQVRLGAATVPCLAALTLLSAAALGVPAVALVRWLLRGASTAFPVGDLLGATTTTVVLAVLGGLLATAAAIPVAWLAVRHRGAVGTLLERAVYPANALPGIVVALALVTVSIDALPWLYQTLPVLVVGYAVLFLPRAVVSVRANLEQAPAMLDDVAASLGCRPSTVLRRVTLPLVLPGLGASLALVSLAVSTELTATLLLAPIGTTTLATGFWARSTAVEYGAAAPYALLLVILSVPATVLLGRAAARSSR